ncbi:HAMP domain-containing protein, partial [Pseudoalteromonas phenolica]
MKSLTANLSTRHKLQLATVLSVVLALVPVLLVLGASSTLSLISLGLAVVSAWFVSGLITQPVNSGIKALETGLLNFKDGEFSSLLAYSEDDELGRLCHTYNQTAEQLRQE